MNRRKFLQRSALGGTAIFFGAMVPGCSTASRDNRARYQAEPFELEEITVTELQRGMTSGRFTAAGVTRAYQRRIESVDRNGPRLKSVIELNPDALVMAE